MASNLPGIERFFDETDIIVSKTDLKGQITYANDIFLEIAGYTEEEVLGKPHSLIRHPAMPRCVFQLLWEVIQGGDEVFAYVVNMTKSGDYYWVLAHVTPTFDDSGKIIGFHSNRRVPNREAIRVIDPLYRRLKMVEDNHPSAKEGQKEAYNMLLDLMDTQELRYDMFIFKLESMVEMDDALMQEVMQ